MLKICHYHLQLLSLVLLTLEFHSCPAEPLFSSPPTKRSGCRQLDPVDMSILYALGKKPGALDKACAIVQGLEMSDAGHACFESALSDLSRACQNHCILRLWQDG